ncbi:hypothetical protein C900_05263 [Fulvivirga imtechensis AK7]|uniref:Uncharacterized protein n=1 Tax=Fulvivirga imtechensis AK7 TaxID=1237149 RepID=L8JZU8_9BACT|nr:hypothetical protein [Fulvivirga imtechensis]ELR73214.1 hypothetical protein C900_05263 [Fulvivirga imtechensis AK7]
MSNRNSGYWCKWILFTITALCGVGSNVHSQNLEAVGKESPLTITGGVSLNQILYAVDGMESRRDPYSYYASGNINFNLYGWSVPLSFTYSNQQGSFQQPFNQYGLHPTYKWVTGHLGYASMNFSPYTLAGHIFLGAGIEARPGKWNVSAMYGRLQKAVEPDSTSEGTVVPAFKRMGYGVKAGYADGNDFVNIIAFRAKDEENSISYVPDGDDILPEENLVLSVAGGKELFSRIVLMAEYAISGITRDTRAPEASLESNKIFDNAGPLFTPRLSSSYYSAFKTGVNYQADAYSIGFGYERIDPGYRTLGAYFFNNDMESITMNTATAFFGGKVNVAANVGVQRDNLDNTKVSTMKRVVGSMNIGYAASERLNFSASYSNFQTFTNIRSQFLDINQLTPYDNLDTLNFTQISQNATLNTNYVLRADKERRQNINLNLTFQDASDQQGGVEQNSGSQFYMANAAYSVSLVPRNLTITGAFNYNENKAATINSMTLGPTLAVSKTLMERKMRVSISTSWNESYTNGDKMSRVANLRVAGGYIIKKKHNFNLSLVTVNRETDSEGGASSFTEFTGTLGYSYSFSSR